MDNIMDSISGILSDEESLRQLSELAQMLGSGQFGDEQCDADSDDSGDDLSGLEMIGRLSALAGAFGQPDKNTELLAALRPHLSAEKQKRLDKAVKLLKIIAIYNAAKDSGIMNELL